MSSTLIPAFFFFFFFNLSKWESMLWPYSLALGGMDTAQKTSAAVSASPRTGAGWRALSSKSWNSVSLAGLQAHFQTSYLPELLSHVPLLSSSSFLGWGQGGGRRTEMIILTSGNIPILLMQVTYFIQSFLVCHTFVLWCQRYVTRRKTSWPQTWLWVFGGWCYPTLWRI